MSKYKCKCCGCYTLPMPSAEALAFICPVCFWENDVFITSDDEPSDENHGLTLSEARRNYYKFGASCTQVKEHIRKPTQEELNPSIKF